MSVVDSNVKESSSPSEFPYKDCLCEPEAENFVDVVWA